MSEQTSQWEETARLHAQNEAFYRGLLDQIGGSVGLPSRHYSDLPGRVREQHEVGLKWHTALMECSDVLGLKCGDSLSEMVPAKLRQLAAREKIYTETVKALEYEFTSAITIREEMAQTGSCPDYFTRTTPHLRQLLSLAREANGKGIA